MFFLSGIEGTSIKTYDFYRENQDKPITITPKKQKKKGVEATPLESDFVKI